MDKSIFILFESGIQIGTPSISTKPIWPADLFMFADLFPSFGSSAFHALFWLLKAYATVRLLKFLDIFLRSIWGHFFSKPLNLEPYKESWTVITGCTDGIGRAYLEELVLTRGIRKVYLIGRNADKLMALSTHFVETYGCQVKTALFDFEKDQLENLPSELEKLPIGILVNCVGIAPDQVANLVQMPPRLASRILRVNLLSCVRMIELVLPGMVQRNLGIVVSVASITGWRPLPYLSAYPASKAAISFFSEALADEFKGTNVKIQCLLPLLVATKMASYAADESNLFVVDTKTFARQAVNIIGNYRLSTGCFMHDMQIAFGTLIGFWLFKQIFVPFGILGIHRDRLNAYRMRQNQRGGEGGK